MIGLSLEESGAKAAARMIEEIGERAVHAEPAMRKTAFVLLAGESFVWARSRWQKRPDGSRAGVLTGALKRSLTEPEAAGAVREIHADHIVFGTNLFYARFMQSGTTVNGVPHEPKRPVLVFRPADRKAVKEIIRLHLLGELP